MITSKTLSVLTVALLFALPSCADHSSVQPTVESQKPAPPPEPSNPDDDTLVATTPQSEPSGNGGGSSNGGGGGSGGSGGGGTGGTGGGGSPGQPVPEPTTILLVGSGLAGMAAYRRRRNKHEDR